MPTSDCSAKLRNLSSLSRSASSAHTPLVMSLLSPSIPIICPLSSNIPVLDWTIHRSFPSGSSILYLYVGETFPSIRSVHFSSKYSAKSGCMSFPMINGFSMNSSALYPKIFFAAGLMYSYFPSGKDMRYIASSSPSINPLYFPSLFFACQIILVHEVIDLDPKAFSETFKGFIHDTQ